MKTFSFELVTNLDGLVSDESIFDISDWLYEAGCSDASVHTYNGTLYLAFNRKADSYEQAVISAIHNVESVKEIKVLSVDAGDWVGLADAATMSGLTKAALSRYSKGTRGKGGFPTPLHRIESRTPLWSWADIAGWMADNGLADSELANIARTTAMLNMSLQLRDNHKLDEINTFIAAIDSRKRCI